MTVDFNSKAYLDKVDALVACSQLHFGCSNVLERQPIVENVKWLKNDLKAHPIGHWGTVPGQNFILCSLEPCHQQIRLGYVLH